jgi:hypothetical protein
MGVHEFGLVGGCMNTKMMAWCGSILMIGLACLDDGFDCYENGFGMAAT